MTNKRNINSKLVRSISRPLWAVLLGPEDPFPSAHFDVRAVLRLDQEGVEATTASAVLSEGKSIGIMVIAMPLSIVPPPRPPPGDRSRPPSIFYIRTSFSVFLIITTTGSAL